MSFIRYESRGEGIILSIKRLSLLLALFGVSFSTLGATFDGKQPLICANLHAVQCHNEPQCVLGSTVHLNIPRFVRIEFQNKQITSTEESGLNKTSKILSTANDNKHLIIQGVDDGLAWSVVIEEDSGNMAAGLSETRKGFCSSAHAPRASGAERKIRSCGASFTTNRE